MSRHRPTPAYPIPTANQTALAVQPGSTVHIDTGDPDDRLVPWERALNLIKNVMVIITCAVLLYTIWRGYVALAALGEGLDQLRTSWVTP